MRHIVIVVPEWIREDAAEDVLRQTLSSLQRMAEAGRLFKISKLPAVECPEALVLGLPPGIAELRQGPLTISALGADPPERSVHFHLSLLQYRDGLIANSAIEPTPDDLRRILEVVPKLNTKSLTFVKGDGRDHGLVWENLGDLHCYTPDQSDGEQLRQILPEGDGDVALRRYIDDSINLLSELELNQRRADADLPLLNLLWPWGNGVRFRLPNLALKRGQPSLVISESLRLQGLSRLVGYRHTDRGVLRSGLQFDLKKAAEMILASDSTVLFLPTFIRVSSDESLEERSWFTKQIESFLLAPIFASLNLTPTRLSLLAPSSESTGLGLELEPKEISQNSIPFDRRALDEKLLPTRPLWESIALNLSA